MLMLYVYAHKICENINSYLSKQSAAMEVFKIIYDELHHFSRTTHFTSHFAF